MTLIAHWPGPSYHHVMRFPPGDVKYESITTQGLGACWRIGEGEGADYGIAMEPLFPELEGNLRLRKLCAGE